jgi:hypothetical protein
LQKVELDDDNNKSPLQRRDWEGLRGLWSGREGEGENMAGAEVAEGRGARHGDGARGERREEGDKRNKEQ